MFDSKRRASCLHGAFAGANSRCQFQRGHHHTGVEKQTELDAGTDKRQDLNPDLERWYAARAGSRKVEVSGATRSTFPSLRSLQL